MADEYRELGEEVGRALHEIGASVADDAQRRITDRLVDVVSAAAEAKAAWSCQGCRSKILDRWKFCPYCGSDSFTKPLAASASQPRAKATEYLPIVDPFTGQTR
mgnify:CR=1 FL=1|jgi:hypothetical protein